jgi:predicted Zn-dependent protease
MELAAHRAGSIRRTALFQFRQSQPKPQILSWSAPIVGPDASAMDKIAGLREILAMDPGNSLARYGIAMELASLGETESALAEFQALLSSDPDYTQGYFMAAQTLARVGRKSEAIERLKAGIDCARRKGNIHAVNEMQAMMDELQP